MKAKIGLIQHGRTVVMWVEKMNEKFRNNELLFEASNGIKIKSVAGPDIDGDTIWLRGDTHEWDNDLALHIEATEEEANEFVRKIKKAFEEWESEEEPDQRQDKDKVPLTTYIEAR